MSEQYRDQNAGLRTKLGWKGLKLSQGFLLSFFFRRDSLLKK